MHGIARHVIADVMRSRQRDAGPDAIEHTADPASIRDALSRAVSAEERDRVRTALSRLTGGDRSILHLSFYEGLTPGEVADRLGLSSLLVRKRKSRALERLRRIVLGDDAGHKAAVSPTPTQGRIGAVLEEPEVSA